MPQSRQWRVVGRTGITHRMFFRSRWKDHHEAHQQLIQRRRADLVSDYWLEERTSAG